jgi:hypothetical protein
LSDSQRRILLKTDLTFDGAIEKDAFTSDYDCGRDYALVPRHEAP